MRYWSLVIMMAFLAAGCSTPEKRFGDDYDFLVEHTDALLLKDGEAMVAVVPAFQGRVMTSSFSGLDGPSLGWINHDLIASGEKQPHINAYGGEDRLWLGPEGGQFAIFFKEGDSFTLKDWQTPALIDTEPFPVKASDATSASFSREARLTNFSGTKFSLRLDRTVRLLDMGDVQEKLGAPIPLSVRMVAYESENTLTNIGDAPWTEEGGLLSLWILGMFNPSSSLMVVIPVHKGPDEAMGPVVNDAYFGKVPENRLTVENGVIFFSGDGEFRSKIGVGPKRAKPVLGSYDGKLNMLTIVQYNQSEGAEKYVNSMWNIQSEPYGGDVVNSYNDGPPEPGAKPLGPFYELETSSPAAALKPGESMVHYHRTMHFTAPKADLDLLARRVLGVSLKQIELAFSSWLGKSAYAVEDYIDKT